jgi:hypothetical protein
VVTLATHNQRKDMHGLAARTGVRLNEATVRTMEANLVKVTGAAESSGILIVSTTSAKSDGEGRSGGFCCARSRGGEKRN